MVTRLVPDGIAAWWAELQVPGEASLEGGRGFWCFSVSVQNGAISAFGHEHFIWQTWQDKYNALWERLSVAGQVPYWEQIDVFSLNAHRELPKVWAIAWDWVITPNGPIFLEGNGGWCLEQAHIQGIDLTS